MRKAILTWIIQKLLRKHLFFCVAVRRNDGDGWVLGRGDYEHDTLAEITKICMEDTPEFRKIILEGVARYIKPREIETRNFIERIK